MRQILTAIVAALFIAGCGGAAVHISEYRTAEGDAGCMGKYDVDSKAFSMEDISKLATGCLDPTAPGEPTK
tara:strand:+ start:4226 stop:4438 length:213 start_codon:yes stop_codon:yes gene_type:complete